MPQGVGYGTVLAGQAPQEPAIDYETGKPLTIEALLARRGLLSVGGNMNLFAQMDRANRGAPASGGGGGASAARGAAVDSAGNRVAAGKGQGPSGLPGVNREGGAQAVGSDAAMESDPNKQMVAPVSTDDPDYMSAIGALAAAGAGGWALNQLRKLFGMRKAAGATVSPEEVNAIVVAERDPAMRASSNNFEYLGTIPRENGAAPQERIVGPAEQRQIGGMMQEVAMADAATQALPSSGVIYGQAPEAQAAITEQRKLPAPERATSRSVTGPRTKQVLKPDNAEKMAVKDAMMKRSMKTKSSGRGVYQGATDEELRKRPADQAERLRALKQKRIPRVRL